jgi:hypothetical protein
MSRNQADRTVHARGFDGEHVVRYDRSGKWWIEYDPPRLRSARQISLGEAVRLVVEGGWPCVFGLSGGSAFDRQVKKAQGGS